VAEQKLDFFVVCPIGWERDVVDQILESQSYFIDKDGSSTVEDFCDFEIEKGGIAWKLPLHIGLQINIFSKLASRVLLRIAEFRAVEFYELEGALRRIDLKSWLGVIPLEYEVSAAKSKLNNEKRIIEVLVKVFGAESILKGQSKVDAKPSLGQALYVRTFQDRFTVSLDTSGEHLHKRGERAMVATASMRETLAHLLLRKAFAGKSLTQLQSLVLYDPFCGAGTLAIEAENYFNIVKTRSFAFQNWVRCPKIFKSASWFSNYKPVHKAFNSLICADIDGKVLDACKCNLQKAQIQSVEFLTENFFDRKIAFEKDVILVANPPYGERLRIDGKKGDFFTQLIEHAHELGVKESWWIIPRGMVRENDFKNAKLISSTDCSNSGIDVELIGFRTH
jgi:putative N6-adenine-specific DNA methylase